MTRKIPWTPEEETRLRALRAEGRSIGECATALGRHPNSVTNKLYRGDFPLSAPLHGPTGTTLPPPPDPVEIARQRHEERKALRERNDLLKGIAGEESFRALVTATLEKIGYQLPAPPPYKAPAKAKGASRETMVQVWSDWHNGETVSAEAMRGFNAFNASIFQQRLDTVVETHRSIKTRLETGNGWRYDRCVISANGDFVSGTIHELEKHSDYDNVVWAVYETGIALANAIRALAADYPLVEVFCTSGNHGRFPDARRVQQKDPTRSWDTLIYLFAKTALTPLIEQKRVAMYIPNAYAVSWEVYGWRFLQTHGHDIKSWNGIPFYGINRMVSNVNALEAGRGTPIHYWLLGHFHTLGSLPHAGGEMFTNGSLIGANEFALNGLGKADRPQQLMLSVHPEHGVTSRWPLYAAPLPGHAR